MLIRLTEAVEDTTTKRYSLREVSINPAQIVAIRPDFGAASALQENRMPEGLSNQTQFTRIYLNTGQHGLSILAVGSQGVIENKLYEHRTLLKG
jgi:hypothetical protein